MFFYGYDIPMTDSIPAIDIGLVGYGVMGKELERLAPSTGCRVTAIFDENTPLNAAESFNFDVAIDFSTPTATPQNIVLLAEKGKNTVVGATGWYEQLPEIKAAVERGNIGLVYGANFSIGMQMFLRIVKSAAHLADAFDQYDPFVHELHHNRKTDSPSGTAFALANTILEMVERKTSIQTETVQKRIEETELHVTSSRGGDIAGTHTVYLDSQADTIEMTHRAKNRSGFALGALHAARWIHTRRGLFDFNQVFDELYS